MEAKIDPRAPSKSDHRSPKSALAAPGRGQEFILAPGGLPGPLREASGEPPGEGSAPGGRPEGSREPFWSHFGSILLRFSDQFWNNFGCLFGAVGSIFGLDFRNNFGTISGVFSVRSGRYLAALFCVVLVLLLVLGWLLFLLRPRRTYPPVLLCLGQAKSSQVQPSPAKSRQLTAEPVSRSGSRR